MLVRMKPIGMLRPVQPMTAIERAELLEQCARDPALAMAVAVAAHWNERRREMLLRELVTVLKGEA